MDSNVGEKRCSHGREGSGEPSDAIIPGGRVKGRKNGRKVNILNRKNYFLFRSTNFKLLNRANGM
jgi:hypothetical protein